MRRFRPLPSARARTGARLLVCVALLAALGAPGGARAGHLTGQGATYTLDADFDEGASINVVHSVPDQLQLSDQTTPFPFIWVAVSSKGTVVKVDTVTGAVRGEYLSSPNGMGRDPSRTTVDKNGNVWVANRAEGGYISPARGLLRVGASGSVVHLGIAENGQCQDRNGNGVIDTSTGYGDVRPWTNADGPDPDTVGDNVYGGVSTAADECILHYVRVNSTGTRHVSVTESNDVWVSGTGERDFDLIDGDTGTIARAEPSVGCGGYGGLIDDRGVIWSARPLLRWDTSKTLTSGNYLCWDNRAAPNGRLYFDSYGLGIDSLGNVWNSCLCSTIRKIAPDGTTLGTFNHGAGYAQGVVVDGNDHVWVAHSLYLASVGHLRNDGTLVGVIPVGAGPTGVSVDAAGRVWSTNYGAGTASRIDPTLNAPLGAVDLETRNLGGNLYNYSDMTGSVLIGAPDKGSWTVVHDGGAAGTPWETVSWNAQVTGDGSLTVTAASSDSADVFPNPVAVANGGALAVPPGRFLQVTVTFQRASTGESPILFDLTIGRKTTELIAYPAVASVRYPGDSNVYLAPSARLTDKATGGPVAGKTVDFYATSVLTGVREPVCSGVTGGDGIASCGGPLELVATALGLGYEAEFTGDAVYAASQDEGPLVTADADLP